MTFDRHDAGTPATAWDALLGTAEQLRLPDRPTRIVVLAAHPDDETLGVGGTIAAASAQDHHVEVVIASDGEASHPDSPTHGRDQLASRRRAEAQAAMSALGARVRFLGQPDGQLTDNVAAITAAVREAVADGGWLLTPWRDDNHPDHHACAEAGRRVAGSVGNVRLWEYPIWAWHWGNPSSDDGLAVARLHRVALDPAAQRARTRARECYASQLHPLSDLPGDEPVLSPGFAAHFDRAFDVLIDTTADLASSQQYFDRLYSVDDDPWGLADRWYERRKRGILLAALPRERFRRAFEPGCATGMLTTGLADRCERVLAVDVAARAVAQTSERLRDRPNVTVSQMNIPEQWPDGWFDLIVLSEIGYYCDDLPGLAGRVCNSLSDDGVLVLCHWRHEAPEHPQTAETVHGTLPALARLQTLARHHEEDFLLDVLSRRPESVARAGRIVR